MPLSRINLQVPYSDKDAAKRFGARWDPTLKLWYIPAGVNPEPLRQWIPAPQAANIRASCYYLAESSRDCWRCARHTPVVAIALPPGHQELYIEDDAADDHWEPVDLAALLLYIADMPEPIPARLRPLAPHYRIDFTQATETFYWMNHCEHCDAKLGDFETLEECNTAFNPMASEGAAAIQLHEFAEPFTACCPSQTYGLDWLELALRDRHF